MSIETCCTQPRHETRSRKLGAKTGHNAKVTEWLSLESWEGVLKDRLWVMTETIPSGMED